MTIDKTVRIAGRRGMPHMPRRMLELFTQLTGLRVRHYDIPAPGLDFDIARAFRALCEPRWRTSRALMRPQCERCLRAAMRRALAMEGVGNYIQAACGAQMYLLSVPGRRRCTAFLALRARAGDSVGQARHPSIGVAGQLLRLMLRHAEVHRQLLVLDEELRRTRVAMSLLETGIRRPGRISGPLETPTMPDARGAPTTDLAHPAVEKMLTWLRERFGSHCSLREFAERLDMNRTYLSHLFSRQMGMTFVAYRSALRLQRAQDLLRHRRATVREAAEGVGYASAGRFRAAFRQRVGMPPARWRALYGRT